MNLAKFSGLRVNRLGSTPNLVALEATTTSAIPSLLTTAISPTRLTLAAGGGGGISGIGGGSGDGPFLASPPTLVADLRAYEREKMLKIRDALPQDSASASKIVLNGDAETIAELTTPKSAGDVFETASDDARAATVTSTQPGAAAADAANAANAADAAAAAAVASDKERQAPATSTTTTTTTNTTATEATPIATDEKNENNEAQAKNDGKQPTIA